MPLQYRRSAQGRSSSPSRPQPKKLRKQCASPEKVKKSRASAPAASEFITLDLSKPQVMKESQRLRIEQLQDALSLAERNSKARATFIKHHLLYYIVHTIVNTLCLTGLGWLVFALEFDGS